MYKSKKSMKIVRYIFKRKRKNSINFSYDKKRKATRNKIRKTDFNQDKTSNTMKLFNLISIEKWGRKTRPKSKIDILIHCGLACIDSLPSLLSDEILNMLSQCCPQQASLFDVESCQLTWIETEAERIKLKLLQATSRPFAITVSVISRRRKYTDGIFSPAPQNILQQ